MTEFADNLSNHETQCQGLGCATIIPAGLCLRFCIACRPLQPIPTLNRRRYVPKAKRQETQVSSPTHVKPACDLHEGDRILLKDNLRILTVSTRPQIGVGRTTVKYDELATRYRGELDLTLDQPVKIICPGWCELDELASII